MTAKPKGGFKCFKCHRAREWAQLTYSEGGPGSSGIGLYCSDDADCLRARSCLCCALDAYELRPNYGGKRDPMAGWCDRCRRAVLDGEPYVSAMRVLLDRLLSSPFVDKMKLANKREDEAANKGNPARRAR